GRIKSVPRTNMLVVTDIPTNLYKIREVIRKLDKSTPQAHIDSKIVKTQIQKGENLGITWAPGVTAIGAERPTTFPFTAERRREDRDFFEAVFGRFYPQIADTANTHAFDTTGFPRPADAITNQGGGNLFTLGTLDFTSFSAVLQFLRTRAHTKVISNPRITVLNNQVASVKVTKDVPYPTYERNETTGSFEISGYDFKSSGVQMKVTPHINDASEILVDLQPEVTSISSTDVTTFTTSTAAALQSLPNINVTTAVTQVLIKSGETIAIGGLMTDSVATTEQKVPFFGDIPLIGKIFRSKDSDQGSSNEKVETLFFVTVTIVDTEGEAVVAPSPQPGTAAAAGNAGPAQTPLTIQSGNVEKI
ncbi:MAG: type II secretion system protein GspD, partial [Candidatus Omnitrophica bacterium]|nr:type II secretion system protein GspD [Candidatus Omnitrophota bacterium]